MKNIDKSIEIARAMFPGEYDSEYGYRTYHFAFLWRRNNLRSVGVNDPSNKSIKAINFAHKFRVSGLIRFPYLHAEVDAISKLWGREKVDSSLTMIVIRLNKYMQLMPSKPCCKCHKIIESLGLTSKLYYSVNEDIVRYAI